MLMDFSNKKNLGQEQTMLLDLQVYIEWDTYYYGVTEKFKRLRILN